MQGSQKCLVCRSRFVCLYVCQWLSFSPQRTLVGKRSSGHRVQSGHQQGNLPDGPCRSICSGAVCLSECVWQSRTCHPFCCKTRALESTRCENRGANQTERWGSVRDAEKKREWGEQDCDHRDTVFRQPPWAHQIALSCHHWSCLAVNWCESIRKDGLCGWIPDRHQ